MKHHLIDRLRSLGDGDLERMLADVLRDEYTPPERLAEVAARYEAERDHCKPAVRRALAFVSFIDRIERIRAGGDRASAVALDDDVVDFIRHWYEVDEERFPLRDVTLVGVGTTSFVVACDARRFALKLLLPWYFDSPTMVEDLDRWARQNADLSLLTGRVAGVLGAGRGWVAVDFVRGGTMLAEWLAESKQGAVPDRREAMAARLEDARTVVAEITAALEVLHALGRAHGDLVPENVVLAGGELDAPVLVDFGPNPDALKRLGRVPPTRSPSASATDDVKALARLLLECVSPFAPPTSAAAAVADGRSSARTRDEWDERVLEDLRQFAPRLAAVVDGLREGRVPPGDGDLYDRVRSAIVGEITTFVVMAQGDPDPLTAIRSPRKRLRNAWDIVSQGRYARELERVARKAQPGSDWPTIVRWMRFYGWAWKATPTVFVLLTVLDLVPTEFGFTFFTSEQIKHGLETVGWVRFEEGLWWKHLLFRSVSVTTAGIAFVYYLNIFSAVPAREVNAWFDRLMRFGPALAMAMQVAVMALAPNQFAWVAGVGGLFISLNNFLWLGELRRRLGKDDETPATREFAQWPRLMLAYSAAGILIGLLLRLHVLHDAWFFAAALTLVNVFKVFLQNCVSNAPRVRGALVQVARTPIRPETATSG